MSLTVGTRLGPYEIREPLGAGGMGEVYRARDTRLGRDVAVKVLPAEFAADPERLRRFEQEARATATLDHPNILAVFDIGTHEGTPYIVEQLLEGESLRQRLRGGPLTPAKAVEFGIQIAQGLAAAHEKGIVHRDLKPENLFITTDGRAKILDFGLARLRQPDAHMAEGRSEAATADSPTREGKVLGTPGYMSPEQVRGHAADARSDIFAFGVVLYEMLAGKRAFEGTTATDVAAAILKEDPAPLPSTAPPVLAQLVRRCLEKRPQDRFSSAQDLAFALEASSGPGAAVTTPTAGVQIVIPRSRLWIGGVVSALLVLAAGAVFVALYLNRAKKPPSQPFEHLKVTRLTRDGKALVGPVISPDGRYVAYRLLDDRDRTTAWVVQVATTSTVQVLPASEDIFRWLAFSPDGNYVYYSLYPKGAGASQLYRVPSLGGAPERQPIEGDVDSPVSFSPDGKHLAFTRGNAQHLTELWTVHSDGTDPRMVTVTTPACTAEGRPDWSPDGAAIAWVRREGNKCFLQLVDVNTGRVRPLGGRRWDWASGVEWMPDARGLLLAALDNSLNLQPQVWLVDNPSGLARPLTSDVGEYGVASVSADGRSLVTSRFETRADIWTAPLDDASRSARITRGFDDCDGQEGLAWTPGGGLVFVSSWGVKRDLWILDRPEGKARRLTSGPAEETQCQVSPDGRTVVFLADLPGSGRAICRINADGSGLKQIASGARIALPHVTPDGRWVLYTGFHPIHGFRVPIEGGTPEPLGNGDPDRMKRFDDFIVHDVSPDGRLLVGWVPDEGGYALSIVPLDGSRARRDLARVSQSVYGPSAVWAPDGHGILYVEALGDLVLWRKSLDASPPRKIFEAKGQGLVRFAVSKDGKQLAYALAEGGGDVVLIQDVGGEEKQK